MWCAGDDLDDGDLTGRHRAPALAFIHGDYWQRNDRETYAFLGEDAAGAARNSPILHLPSRAAPLVVAVGLRELPELIRQLQEYAAAWNTHGLAGRYLPVAGRDHFSMLEEPRAPEAPFSRR